MDNAGENKILARHCDENEMGIKFEYTAPVHSNKMELYKEHL